MTPTHAPVVTSARLMAQGRGTPLGFWLMVGLIVSLQFGPIIGLLGFRLTGSTAFTLAGGARDGLVIALVTLAGASLLMSTAPWRLPASAQWALFMVLVYLVFALASPENPLLVALNLRRLGLVPMLFVALIVLPWSAVQLQRLMALIIGSSVVVAAFGLIERFSPTTLWSSVLDVV